MNSKFPIAIFIALQLASGAVLTLWVVWSAYAQVHVMWLLQGIILMAAVIVGAVFIFVYWTKAKALDRDRSNFLSSVSHELLTPLSSIKLGLETMQIRKLNAEQRATFLDRMTGDTERLSELIASILIASRIERRKAFYKFVPRDLTKTIEAFLKENKALLKDSQVETQLDRNCWCLFDQQAFQMVLKNLLQNAIRYSPSPARIDVVLKRVSDTLRLEVTDRGEGINPQNLKKVFKLFYRDSSKRRGTGMGLFIVKNIVHDHKGKVWAESVGDGQGTSIKMLLPAERQPTA